MSNSNDSANNITKKTLSTAVSLSLASGIIILISSLIPWLFFANTNFSSMGGMMGNIMTGSSMGWLGMPGSLGWMSPLTLMAGIMILFGAIMMQIRPKENSIWGIIVIIFSVMGFTGMGFSILGAIIGIIGGAIALIEKSDRMVE